MRLLIIVVLVVLLILSWPSWRHKFRNDPLDYDRPWHRNYEYFPTGGLALLLILAVVLIFLGII
jgi:heme/copper-type cytochrome/quinol oxidase subunit 2